ncbi:MAG: PemK family transcriptional regulator [Mycoplasmataceae bacterium RC_NB112A]|nr:MAG: PemK family transcriptional regulator [Mycoplasmataceae bacterium RC_NB112A]
MIKYRSVYWVRLGKTVGSEIRKIISNDLQNKLGKRVAIIPFTTTPIPSIPFHIPIEFAGKIAKILPEQIRFVDKKRVGDKIGELPEAVMLEIEGMLYILLNFHD